MAPATTAISLRGEVSKDPSLRNLVDLHNDDPVEHVGDIDPAAAGALSC